MKKTARQQWDAVPDLATPTERRWLDEWGSYWQRYGSGRIYKITSRSGPGDGQFGFVTMWINRCAKWVLRQGVMAITLDQIKADVRRYRREAARERRREAENMVGAYI